jgi:glutamate formiminotransferase
MKRLIECVPNFSEGRDASKLDAIVAAMRGVHGVLILDRSSDVDHNRSVVTLAGEPEAVAEAALRGVGKAAELIDLTRHSGVHPRIGATDVLPFIPVEGCTIEDCVALAHRVGREIWDRFRIPVYFYEAAAMKPERVNLEDVRRGQFEGLLEDAFRNPDRSPDIGEPRLHPSAGAVAVGARKFLIAYNIHLDTPDVSIAKEIAKAVRFSSGGLRYVKAMGVELKSRGLAQVSMNLTDFEQTPLHRVFEMVKREAERHGCRVIGSEIVGLIPRKALELTAEFYLKLENFSPGLVLENRLASAMENLPVQKPIDPVPSLSETVKAGSVAALAGALAARAGEMAARVTSKCASDAELADDQCTKVQFMHVAAHRLLTAIDRDAESEQTVDSELHLTIDSKSRHRVDASFEIALAAAEVFEQLVQLETIAAPSILADLQVARAMATASARGALATVTANLSAIEDLEYVLRMKSRAATIEARLAPSPEPVTQEKTREH